jgi:hypothetical protein
MAWFRSRGEWSALEGRLRAERPEPGVEVERRIVRSIGRSSGGRARVGLALVLTTGVFAAMAGFGGVGYAFDSVKSAVNPANVNTPSNDQYGTGGCVEYVNPHGKTIPPAGLTPPGTNPKGGENPDGFYQVGTPGSSGPYYVMDLGSGQLFGPFSGGTVIKYTQATGATPSQKSIGSTNGQAGAVSWHITGTGDFEIIGGGGPPQVCLVPRPPK